MKTLRALLISSQIGLIALLLPVSVPAALPTQFQFQAEIVEHGAFELIGSPTVTSAAGTASGKVAEHEGIRLVRATTSLNATLGTTFGFRYRVVGLRDGANDGFEMRAIHPAMKTPSGGMQTVSTADAFVFGRAGMVVSDIVYKLSEPAEVLPGRWTLQLLYKRQVILTRDFDLE